jgi:hypothetical protein
MYVIQNRAKLVTIGLSKTIRLNQTIVNNRIESDGSFGKRPLTEIEKFITILLYFSYVQVLRTHIVARVILT